MLGIEHLPAFFKAHGIAQGTAFSLNRRPPTPDALVQIVEIPGMPMMDTEEAYDNAAIQTFVRSPRDDHKAARDLAHALDRILLDDAIRPYALGGQNVLASGRLGGGPTFWDIDADNRAIYYGAYWITIER